MIESERDFGTTTIYCSKCGFSEMFDRMIDVVGTLKQAREVGWIINKVDREWECYCSEECLRGD